MVLVSCRALGGMEAERAERTRIKEEAAARDRRNFEWMQQLRREGFRKVRAQANAYIDQSHTEHEHGQQQ
jgi:hypothetical protein